jgi:hypothetical protein
MRRYSRFPVGFLSRAWRSVTFVMTLRAAAKPYRSRRLYPTEDGGETLDLVASSGGVQ